MSDFIKYLVEAIMDAIEEFFSALVAPSIAFTFYAFLVSLGFVVWSIVAEIFMLPSFVGWQEAVTCSILLLIIVMIDAGARNSVKKGLQKIKGVTSRFTYTGESEENKDSIELEENGNGEE